MSKLYVLALVISLFSFLTIVILYNASDSFSIEQYHNCPAPPAPQDLCNEPNISKTTPKVKYPTKAELFAYINQSGSKKEFTPLSNSSQGFGSNVQTAVAGNTTWIAWEGNVNGNNKIFIKVAYNESLIFTPAVELSAPDAGNASKLQLGTSDDGNLVYATWQDTDITTGKNRIFVSSSMNGGEEFRTYTLNLPGDANSIDPTLTVVDDEVIINWIQAGPDGSCGPVNGTVCSHGRW